MHLHGLLIVAAIAMHMLLLAEANVQKLQLNTNSTIYDDIKSVSHDATERKVLIELHEARRCDYPTFLARLSGAALYKLAPGGAKDNIWVFTYPQLVDPGKYFLEVIVLFCAAYQADSAQNQCLENVYFGKNVVNLHYSFEVPRMELERKAHPRWVFNASYTKPKLLPTRHQRLVRELTDGVACAKTIMNKYCAGTQDDLAPSAVYKWTDGPCWKADAYTVYKSHTTRDTSTEQSSSGAPLINVCFVGDSHSRMMSEYRTLPGIPKFIQFVYVLSLFPMTFNETELDTYHCSVAVISHGLWTLARPPYARLRTGFTHELDGLAQRLVQWGKPGKAPVFFRSENHNGLLMKVTSCGGRDQRSPPEFDMINRITEEVGRQRGIPFISMDHIVAPMWDAAIDFNHPPRAVFIAEIDLILHRVFTEVLRRQTPLVTYPASAMKGLVINFVPTNAQQDEAEQKLIKMIAAEGKFAARQL